MEQGQAEIALSDWHEFRNAADKKTHSGTAVFTRYEPLSVSYGMDVDRHNYEGRLITLEHPEFRAGARLPATPTMSLLVITERLCITGMASVCLTDNKAFVKVMECCGYVKQFEGLGF